MGFFNDTSANHHSQSQYVKSPFWKSFGRSENISRINKRGTMEGPDVITYIKKHRWVEWLRSRIADSLQ